MLADNKSRVKTIIVTDDTGDNWRSANNDEKELYRRIETYLRGDGEGSPINEKNGTLDFVNYYLDFGDYYVMIHRVSSNQFRPPLTGELLSDVGHDVDNYRDDAENLLILICSKRNKHKQLWQEIKEVNLPVINDLDSIKRLYFQPLIGSNGKYKNFQEVDIYLGGKKRKSTKKRKSPKKRRPTKRRKTRKGKKGKRSRTKRR